MTQLFKSLMVIAVYVMTPFFIKVSFATLPVKQGTSMCTLGDCALQGIPKSSPQATKQVRTLEQVTPSAESSKAEIKVTHYIKRPTKRFEVSDQIHTQYSKNISLSEDIDSDEIGNLPSVYRGANWKDFAASTQTAMITPQTGAKLKGVRAGDVLYAVIEDELEVWPGRANPVRAFITRGPLRGSIASGEAVMEPGRKKVMITFDRLRLKDGSDTSYKLKSELRALTGRTGLDGNYHSESSKFFIAEVLSGAASGFTDATIQRTQNSLGNYVMEPSMSNAAKNGAVVALSKRAERFANEEAHAPEWTEAPGYQEVQIFIQADPIEEMN